MAVGGTCPRCEKQAGETDEKIVLPGDTYTFAVGARGLGLEGDEAALTVLLAEEWAALSDRSVYVAEAVSCRRLEDGEQQEGGLLDSMKATRFLVEVHHRDLERGLNRLPSTGTLPLRTPIGQKRIDGHEVYLYRNNAGISLAELVTLADGELELRRIADLYAAVLDGLEQLHGAGVLHLFLTPEMVRVRPENSTVGIPLTETDPEATDPDTSPVAFGEDTDVERPKGQLAGEGDGENPFGSEKYEQTRPQTPLGSRLEALGTDDFPVIEEGEVSLSESTSEVNEAGIDEEGWIYELLGAEQPEQQFEAADDRAVSAEQRAYRQPPDQREPMQLEVLFDSVCGMFSISDPPSELEVVPGFSAPEAYTHGDPSLNAVSDVFSAGMLLYYLISGQIPPVSVYTRHAPAVPARNFRPSFPPGLAPVVKRATRPDPEMRYPDLASLSSGFANAIEAIEDRVVDYRDETPSMEAAVDRHTGIAKRERNPVNQDDVFYGSCENGEFALIVVADGVSTASYGSGDVASSMLIEVAEEVWNDILPAHLMEESVDDIEIVREVFTEANDRIVDYVNERHTPFDGGAHEVMGTTGLVALYHEGRVTLGSVGDSRGYLQRGPGLDQLTVDHNLWTLSILEGVPADDALSMPRGDALARCLGAFDIEEGLLEAKEPGVEIVRFPVTSGDTLLLTTDGLVDFAGSNVSSSEENILSTLLSEPDPALACLELILLANRGGGGDNIGLGVARFH